MNFGPARLNGYLLPLQVYCNVFDDVLCKSTFAFCCNGTITITCNHYVCCDERCDIQGENLISSKEFNYVCMLKES